MEIKKDDIVEIPKETEYCFAPCLAIVTSIRDNGFIGIRIDDSEREWMVEAKDVKKYSMDKRPYIK